MADVAVHAQRGLVVAVGLGQPAVERQAEAQFAVQRCAQQRRHAWHAGQTPLGLLGMAYSLFAFFGLGREPFAWSLLLGAAGLPLYVYMKRQRAR